MLKSHFDVEEDISFVVRVAGRHPRKTTDCFSDCPGTLCFFGKIELGWIPGLHLKVWVSHWQIISVVPVQGASQLKQSWREQSWIFTLESGTALVFLCALCDVSGYSELC